MDPRLQRPQEARRLLELARTDRGAAREALDALGVDAQVAVVCEAPPALRGEVLALTAHPEAIIPRLPESELCFAVKALGLADAGWILAAASDEQLVACVDLDAWQGERLDPSRLDDWVDALAEAGDARLASAFQVLDRELVTLYLQSRVEVFVSPGDDDWQPPKGAQTLDGQLYFRARKEGDDLAVPIRVFKLAVRDEYSHYFWMLQAVNWETPIETTDWAQRWRTGRLLDLGFPPWDEALALYARLPDAELERLPANARPLAGEAWRLPIWPPRLPTTPDARHAVFRAAAGLDEDERRAFFYAFVAAANGVAVLDELPLGDAESIPAAIEKVARLASAGVERLAGCHGLDVTEVLRRASVERLVRVGANLERLARPERPPR